MDSRIFRAETARAACEAGGFKLMGRPLRALSAHHVTLLNELGIDFASTDDLPREDLEIISRVCSEREPTGYFPGLDHPDVIAKLRAFDLAAENDIRDQWLLLCWESRPATRQFGAVEGGASMQTIEVNCPDYLYIISRILASLSGYEHDDLYYDRAVAWLHWRFESMREVEDGVSHIHPRGEEPKTEDLGAFDDAHDARAGDLMLRVTAHFMPLLEGATSQEERTEIEADMNRMLSLAAACRLDVELNELPEVNSGH